MGYAIAETEGIVTVASHTDHAVDGLIDEDGPAPFGEGETGDRAAMLKQAVADAAAAFKTLPPGLSNDTRDNAFLRLLDARLALPADAEPAPRGNGRSAAALANGNADDLTNRAQRVCAISKHLDIEEERVPDLFDVEGPIPILGVRPSSLAQNRTDAVRQIAVVLTAARTALDMATSTADLRDAARHYGKFDGNFSAILDSTPGIALRGKPRSPNRRVQLLAPGTEQAKRIAQELLD